MSLPRDRLRFFRCCIPYGPLIITALPSANRERSFDFAWVHVLQELSRQKNLNIESQRYSLVEDSIHRAVFLRKGDRRGLSDPQGQEHPQLWLAMPGLPPAACDPWLPPCHCAWAQDGQQNYVARDDRQRPDGGGRAAWPGVQMEDKRLGLVYDGTGYPRQAMRAFAFGLGQSTANAWRPQRCARSPCCTLSKYRQCVAAPPAGGRANAGRGADGAGGDSPPGR